MIHVRRLFRMIGQEGASLRAVKLAFEADGVKTGGGGSRWHASTVREMVFNDVYFPHTYAELEAFVQSGNLAPDVLAAVSPEEHHGIQWYSKNRWESDSDGRRIATPRPKDEWIAILTPDAGVPREHIEAACALLKDNVRPSDAGHSFWSLKGIAYCPCEVRLKPHTVNKKHGPRFYYICYTHRSGTEPCPYGKYLPAGELERRVEAFVLDLIRDPETLREQFEAEVAREKATLLKKRKHITALASRLGEIDAERERLVRLYTRGGITDEEFDTHTQELAVRKKCTEEELAKIEDVGRYIEHLGLLAENVLEELPEDVDYMPRIREYERLDVGPHYILPDEAKIDLSMGEWRKRTPEEIEQLRREVERKRAERYRDVFNRLNLKVVAYPNGDLEISWIGGVRKVSGGAYGRPDLSPLTFAHYLLRCRTVVEGGVMTDTVTTLEDYEVRSPDVLRTLEMFAELIRTGQAWTLEGTYKRAATELIEGGYIPPTGEIAQKGYEATGVRKPKQENQRLLT